MRPPLASASFISHILFALLLFTLWCPHKANAQFGFFPGIGRPGFGNGLGFGFGGNPGFGGFQPPFPYNFGGGFGNRFPCYGGYFCGGGYPYPGGYPFYGNGQNTAFASSSGNGFSSASASSGSGFFG